MYHNLKDLQKQTEIFYSTSQGPGGQRRDRKKTGVRLLHLPSGIVVRADSRTSQSQNKKIAFRTLRERLEKLNQRKKKRIPTSIPRSIKEKILKRKKYLSQKKSLRRRPFHF